MMLRYISGKGRVWDIQYGTQLQVLAGHTDSVRALDICGNKLVSVRSVVSSITIKIAFINIQMSEQP